jgi:glycosyltransferase involved in cell wall biosynthesis
MPRVLVVAYYFPPLGLSGVQRTLKFVKYLPEYDWEPTVLTVENRGYFAKDDSLAEELRALPVRVLRTRSFDPLHLLRRLGVVRMPSRSAYGVISRISQAVYIPDNKIAWKRPAVEAGRSLLREQRFDAIFATAPPFTDLLIGASLHRAAGIPLVVDYRDAWLANPFHRYPSPLHRALHHRLEANVLRSADRIVTINRRIKELLVSEHRTLGYGDVDILPQGYDGDDFSRAEAPAPRSGFRIVHAGSLYASRTPVPFFQALRRVLAHDLSLRGRLEAVFAGIARKEDLRAAADAGLDGVVRFTGYVPHRACVAMLLDADALLLLINRGPGEDMISTGKLYEYLGARRTILATIPDGEARRTLERSGGAIVTDPDDPEAIARGIEDLLALHARGTMPRPREDIVAAHDRRTIAGDLARILDSVQRLGPPESRVERIVPDPVREPGNP